MWFDGTGRESSAGLDARLAVQRRNVALRAGIHTARTDDAGHSLGTADGSTVEPVNQTCQHDAAMSGGGRRRGSSGGRNGNSPDIYTSASSARGEILLGVHTLEALLDPIQQSLG